MSIAIDGADAANGALQLAPGYHHELMSTPGELRKLSADEAATILDEDWRVIETNPGDVVIFHSLTPHCSGRNTSDRSRRTFFLTYNRSSKGDVYAEQQAHYHAYSTRNRKEGEGAFFFR